MVGGADLPKAGLTLEGLVSGRAGKEQGRGEPCPQHPGVHLWWPRLALPRMVGRSCWSSRALPVKGGAWARTWSPLPSMGAFRCARAWGLHRMWGLSCAPESRFPLFSMYVSCFEAELLSVWLFGFSLSFLLVLTEADHCCKDH